MDYKKLKIDTFKSIGYFNFEDQSTEVFECYEAVIYFIKELDDVKKMVELVKTLKMVENNRVILVYKKGQPLVNRDSIIKPFKDGTYTEFKMKAPMLCSLDKTTSAFVMSKEIIC